LTDFVESSEYEAYIPNVVSSVTESLEWGNINEPSESLNTTLKNSLPPNYDDTIDLTYLDTPNLELDTNYGGNIIMGRDDLQFSQFAITDDLNRNGMVYQMDLNRDTKSSGSVYFLLKRWSKHNVYNRKVASTPNRDDDPKISDYYDSSSVYLYDLMAVTPSFLNTLVFTASVDDEYRTGDLPSFTGPPAVYSHLINTFKQTPNERFSNVKAGVVDPVYTYRIVAKELDESSDIFYEMFNGYPRNHYTHKMMTFSPDSFPTIVGIVDTGSLYVRGRNSVDSTVGEDGINDGSYPVTTIDVGNVNIVKSDSVLDV